MSQDQEVEFNERVPEYPRRGQRPERVRVRGEASEPGAKVGSLLLSIPLMGLTVTALAAVGVAQIQRVSDNRQDVGSLLLLSGAVASLLVAALFWGAIARMSSVGPTLWGLVSLAVGALTTLRPRIYDPVNRLLEPLPFELSFTIQNGVYSGAATILGALLLGLAFAASLTRRAPRWVHPDTLGL